MDNLANCSMASIYRAFILILLGRREWIFENNLPVFLTKISV